MTGKKAFKIILAGLLLMLIAGCSETTPTGELVYESSIINS